MFMRMSVAVSLLLGGVFAQADQYKYGAVSVTCESYVTSQTIDSAVQQIGSVPIEQITYSYLRIGWRQRFKTRSSTAHQRRHMSVQFIAKNASSRLKLGRCLPTA
jgi:hypothetical protein